MAADARLGRGRYFGRALSLGLITCLIAFPLDDRYTIRHWVGCSAQALAAAVVFTGLQLVLTFWSIRRLRDAGHGAGWAAVPWLGAVPGLLQAGGHPPGADAQAWLYGAATVSVLVIGALPPAPGGTPGRPETVLGRWWRRAALIAILAYVMVIVPQYGDAAPRALIAEDFALALMLKQAVTAGWERTGRLPGSNREAGLPPPRMLAANTVTEARVESGGRIVLRYDDARLPCAARNRSLILSPVVRDGALVWRCAGGDMPGRFRPETCR